jgi:NADH-quinone oxidoreductase subunit L
MVHSNEMKDMGGLRKLMPITHISFLIACLAIAGIPPFSGFFSKEEILMASFESNKLVYAVALITSGLTAFYMFRLYYSIFWSKETDTHLAHHGEGTWSMKIPLILLAILAVVAGFVPVSSWITADGNPIHSSVPITFSILPVSLAIAGILLATRLFKTSNELPQRIAIQLGGLYKAASHKFYIDEVYLFITKKVLFNLVGRPAAWFDKNIVDGFMNLLAKLTSSLSELIKGFQSGKVQDYALYFFGGIAGLIIAFIYLWK